MKQTNISLTKPQHQTLSELSEKTGLSKSEIIRRALDNFTKPQSDWWNEISQAERDSIKRAEAETGPGTPHEEVRKSYEQWL